MKNVVRMFALLLSVMLLLCACANKVKITTGSDSVSVPSGSSSTSVSVPVSSSTSPSIPTSDPTIDQTSDPMSDPTVEPTVEPTADPTIDPTFPTIVDGQYVTNENLSYEPFYPEEKVIAFTFDDGPDYWTKTLLDIFEEGDHVTFFVNGYMMEEGAYGAGYEKYIKRAYDEGHEIGIHTYDHKNLYYESKKQSADESLIAEQLLKIEEKVMSITGEKPWLLRPPGGAFVRSRNYGYTIVHWSIDTQDWLYANDWRNGKLTAEETAQTVYEKNILRFRSGDIVLMHDCHKTSVMAFEMIYKTLKEQGYRFVTVSELLGIDAKEYTGYYFHSTGIYGYNGTTYDLSRTTGQISKEVHTYSFEVTSPVLKREED